MSLLFSNINSSGNLSTNLEHGETYQSQYDFTVNTTITGQAPCPTINNFTTLQAAETESININSLIEASDYDFDIQKEILASQIQSIVSEYQESSDILAANTWQIFNKNPIWKTVKSLSGRKLFEKFGAEYFTTEISPSITSVTETLFNNEIGFSNMDIMKRDTTHLEKSLIIVAAFSAVVFANTFLNCFFAPGTILISYGISVFQCFAGIGLSSSLFIITWVMFVATLQYSYELFKGFSSDSVVKREENASLTIHEWNKLLSESHYIFNKVFGRMFQIEKITRKYDANLLDAIHEFRIIFSDDLKRCDLFRDVKFGMKIDSEGIINLNVLFMSHNDKVSSSEDIYKSPYRKIFESTNDLLTNKVDTKRLVPHNSALKIIASFDPEKINSDPKAFSFYRVSSFFIKNTINISFKAATDIGRHGFKFNPLKYITKFGDALNQFHESLYAKMEITSNFNLFE